MVEGSRMTPHASSGPAAHTPREPGGEWHDLGDHLRATADLAEANGRKFGAGNLAALAGLLHAVRLERGYKPPIKDLIVLASQRDPFYAGTDTEKAMAEWFEGIFGEATGAHLRRIHYRLVARGDVVRHDGRLYENDKNSWNYLGDASRFARYLGLVDPEDIVDRRNPAPRIYMAPGSGFEPEWSYELETNRLDRIHTSLGTAFHYRLSPPVKVETEVDGYHYEEALQPYHVEVWAEKTTMNDILVPLCRTLGANYVSGAGYQSITAMVALLRDRVANLEKPTRVLYVSDYDAAGRNMPKQMARHMEFWSERYGTDYDIRVEPIVMTAEQAVKYPAAPDTGAVELDAMQELDPGLLRRIVREHVAQFRDFDLSQKVHENALAAQEAVDEAVNGAIAGERAAVEEVKGEAEEIYERYRARLETLAAELNEELAPLDERLETLQQAVREKLEALEPDLPPLPEGAPEDDPEDEDWLFDSRRDYLEQLDYYKDR